VDGVTAEDVTTSVKFHDEQGNLVDLADEKMPGGSGLKQYYYIEENGTKVLLMCCTDKDRSSLLATGNGFTLNGKKVASGEGGSKKAAEMAAAENALAVMQRKIKGVNKPRAGKNK